MNRIALLCVTVLFSWHVSAQRVYSLQQCIDSALAHNITVKRSGLSAEIARVSWNQSRLNLLPDVNAGIQHNRNSGRSIDPFTNTYVNQTVNAATYGLNSGIVLFSGLSLRNSIRQNASAYDASRMEWQQAKNDLVLDVIASYLQVLGSEDQVQFSLKQLESSQAAMDRLAILDKEGAIRPSDLYDLKGQVMADQLNLLNARMELETSRLDLALLMNRKYDSSMRVERIDPSEFLSPYPGTADELYLDALEKFALVKAV
jgi:outer membrane protein